MQSQCSKNIAFIKEFQCIGKISNCKQVEILYFKCIFVSNAYRYNKKYTYFRVFNKHTLIIVSCCLHFYACCRILFMLPTKCAKVYCVETSTRCVNTGHLIAYEKSGTFPPAHKRMMRLQELAAKNSSFSHPTTQKYCYSDLFPCTIICIVSTGNSHAIFYLK